MGFPDGPPQRPDDGDFAEARAEALDVVSDALQWRLNEMRWQSLEHILAAMDAAMAASDAAALMAATANLELVGPVRLTRIGATPAVPPPAPVRDRLNRLVHSLSGTPAQEREEPA
jgi:CATRA-Associated Small Protein